MAELVWIDDEVDCVDAAVGDVEPHDSGHLILRVEHDGAGVEIDLGGLETHTVVPQLGHTAHEGEGDTNGWHGSPQPASELHGMPAPDCDGWDALASLFMAVTAPRSPKARAYDANLRPNSEPRGLRAGSVLTLGQNGTFDAATVLRSVHRRDGHTWLHAGACIVSESRPERVLTETRENLHGMARGIVRATSVGTEVLGLDTMRRDVAAVLRCPQSEIDDETNLLVQGLDSVGLMTVVSKWSAYGIRLKVADLARDPRLIAWAALVREMRLAAKTSVR